jgi:hypothetical protein
MFSTEIKQRQIGIPMCVSKDCDKSCSGECGNTVWKALFALDDAFSWIVVAEKRNGKYVKQSGEKGGLYCVDEVTGSMRRQNELEGALSKLYFLCYPFSLRSCSSQQTKLLLTLM